MKFLVLIPCFKEMENLQKLVPHIIDTYPDSHVLVVDDYSNDLTDHVMDGLAENYPNRVFYLCRKSNPSYAASLMEGFNFAASKNFDKIVQMDADGSHSVTDIKRLVATDANIAIGSRYKYGSKVLNVPVLRQAASILGNVYTSILWRTVIRDKTNAFRCFDRIAISKILEFRNSSEGFAVQIELLHYLMQSRNIKIYEVPITFEYRTIGESKFDSGKLLEAFRVATNLAVRRQ